MDRVLCHRTFATSYSHISIEPSSKHSKVAQPNLTFMNSTISAHGGSA